jgi:HTH-type transcriptional regulator, sugar sensing transcriptional regulator
MPDGLVDHPDFIASLRAMGLSQYEAQVYLALLGEGAAEVPTVIRKASIPQNKAYESLVSLERKGFAEALIGDRKRYCAVEPGVAFDRYRRSVEGSLGQAEAAMREIAAATPKTRLGAPTIQGIRVITAEQVGPMFEEKMARANTELLVALRLPVTKIGDAQAAREAQTAGLNTKWLIERAMLDDRKTGAAVRDFAVAIGNARVADFVPLRFAVYDRKECIVEMRESDNSRFALLVPNSGFAEDLRALFLRLWSEAEPVSAKRKTRAAH